MLVFTWSYFPTSDAALHYTGTRPLFDNVMAHQLLPRNIFAFHLAPLGASLGSSIVFGGMDESRVRGPLAWVPRVTSSAYWQEGPPTPRKCRRAPRIQLMSSSCSARAPTQVSMSEVYLGGRPLGACTSYAGAGGSGECRVAVDTGTSLFTGPSTAIRRLSRRLRGLLGAQCEGLASMPPLAFTVSGHTFNFAPADYILHTAAGSGEPEECALGFMALDVPPPRGPMWVFGDVFLRKYAAVFDRDRDRIGFALANHDSPAARMHAANSRVQRQQPATPALRQHGAAAGTRRGDGWLTWRKRVHSTVESTLGPPSGAT